MEISALASKILTALFVPCLVLATAGCSINTGKPSSGSSGDPSKASGAVTGDVAGTISKSEVLMLANSPGLSGAAAQIQTEPTIDNQTLSLTSPASSTLSSASFVCLFQFTSVPTTGTYDLSSSTAGMNFGVSASYAFKDDTTKVGQLSALKGAADGTTTASITITSLDKILSNAAGDQYAVHGSIDATLGGGEISPSGTKPLTAKLHLDF